VIRLALSARFLADFIIRLSCKNMPTLLIKRVRKNDELKEKKMCQLNSRTIHPGQGKRCKKTVRGSLQINCLEWKKNVVLV